MRIYNYPISLYDEWHAQARAVTLAPVAPVLAVNVAVRFVTREKF